MEALKKSGKNMTQSKYSPWVGEKIKKVSQRQAIAVALSMSKRKSM